MGYWPYFEYTHLVLSGDTLTFTLRQSTARDLSRDGFQPPLVPRPRPPLRAGSGDETTLRTRALLRKSKGRCLEGEREGEKGEGKRIGAPRGNEGVREVMAIVKQGIV